MVALPALVALLLVAPAPQVVLRITDPRIDEASGIAVGIRTPGVLYVQNDSGERNRFFAVDARTGRTRATVTVPGATNVDWEDIAVAPDAAGTPSVWLADTGDNTASRDEVRIYRVDEPRLTGGDKTVTSARPDVWRLRYPDGARDAESLAVDARGRAYVVSKSFSGTSGVYRVPASPGPIVRTMTRVADVTFGFTGTPGGPNAIGQLTATGAGFSRDGGVFAVRTYTDAYLWRVADGDLPEALARDPVRVALPSQPQGEGIAVAGDRLLVDSEGEDQPVYSVAVPPLPTVLPTTAPTSSATSPDPSGQAGGRSDSTSGNNAVRAYAVVAALVVAGGLAALVRSRRRR